MRKPRLGRAERALRAQAFGVRNVVTADNAAAIRLAREAVLSGDAQLPAPYGPRERSWAGNLAAKAKSFRDPRGNAIHGRSVSTAKAPRRFSGNGW